MEQVKSSLYSLPLPRKIKENILRLELIKEVWGEVVKDCKLSFSRHPEQSEGFDQERCLANARHDRVGLSPQGGARGLPLPSFIEDDYLFVEADEHYLLQRLRLQSHLLCQRLNQRLKEASLPPIKGIKTRLVVKPYPNLTAQKLHFRKQTLSSKDLQALLDFCQSSLSDTELKGLFLRLIKTLYA